MQVLSQKRNLFILSLIFSILLIATSFLPSHATGLTCSDGSTAKLATQAQADSASPAGSITAGVTSICPDDVRLGISNDVGKAKEYLKSLPKEKLSNCGTDPNIPSNIDKLNPTFAVCAANFFKAYNQKYGGVVISSAYRDDASGANKCAGGAPGSNHTRGLAIDVHPAGASTQNPSDKPKYKTMWEFASQNPQFGICFPFQDHPLSGYANGDWPHMILAGIGGSEGGKCAAQGVTKACSGAPVTNYNTPTAGTTNSPTSVLSNALCSLTGTCASQQTTANGCLTGYVLDNSGNCVQQTTVQQQCYNSGGCQTDGYCVTSMTPLVVQKCSGQTTTQSSGSSGTSGSSGSTGSSGSSGSSGSGTGTTGTVVSTTGTATTTSTTINPVSSLLTTTNTNLTATSTGSSTADLLSYYINLANNPSTTTSSTKNATNTPIALNTNTTDIATLLANDQSNQATITYTGTTDTSNGSGDTSTNGSGDTIVTIQPTSTAGQTFTTQDLSGTNVTANTSSTYNPTSLSFAQKTLQTLSGILQQLLSYLTPFGGRAQTVTSGE